MNEKITQYLDGVFAPYDGAKNVSDLKNDLLADLQERFRELKTEGKDDLTAYEMTIDSIGDIEQTLKEVAGSTRSPAGRVLINFSATNLQNTDFAGVTAHKGKFEASALRGANFSGADLTATSFKASDVRESNFDGTNLTDCTLSVSDFRDSSFVQSIVVRTRFDMSDMSGARFKNVKLVDAKLNMLDLRETKFENCIFEGVHFKYTDLKEQRLDGQIFIGVIFDGASLSGASFRGATLRNVSFKPPFSLFSLKRYFNSLRTIDFEGAFMDKLTHNSLIGMGVDVSKVTII